MQTCKHSLLKTLAKKPTSNNTGYGEVTVGNLPPSRQFYGSLERREIPRSFIARFHTKYQVAEGCWLWQAGKYAKGYGMFSLGQYANGKQHVEYAHRVAHVIAKGDIPEGQVVRHTCDVPACVNPDHLVLGTQGDNVQDAASKGHYNVPHRAGSRKLTDAQVEEILTSSERGARLAERFGVSKTAISLIRNGKRRQHSTSRRRAA